MPDNDAIKNASLATIKGGVAIELFDHALSEVIAPNIADLNTPADAKRKIVLEVEFEPSLDRSEVRAHIKVTPKPAPPKPATGTIFVGTRNGKPVAVTHDPAQSDLFREDDPNLRPLRPAQEGAAS